MTAAVFATDCSERDPTGLIHSASTDQQQQQSGKNDNAQESKKMRQTTLDLPM